MLTSAEMFIFLMMFTDLGSTVCHRWNRFEIISASLVQTETLDTNRRRRGRWMISVNLSVYLFPPLWTFCTYFHVLYCQFFVREFNESTQIDYVHQIYHRSVFSGCMGENKNHMTIRTGKCPYSSKCVFNIAWRHTMYSITCQDRCDTLIPPSSIHWKGILLSLPTLQG